MAPSRGGLARRQGPWPSSATPAVPVLGDMGPVHVLEAKRSAGWPPSLSQLFGGSGFRGIGSDGYRACLTIKKKMIARRPVGSAGPCHARCSGARAALRGGGLVLLFVTFALGAPSVPRGPRCGGCSPPAASRSAACSAASTAPSPRPRGPFAGPRAQRTAVTGTTVCPGRNTAPSSAPRGSHPRPIKPQGLRVPVRQTRPACPIQHSWPRRSLRPTAPRDLRAP